MNVAAVIQHSLPSNPEAEASLCGALMSDPNLVDIIADKLAQEDFSDQLFGRIFGAIVYEHSNGRVATPITLKTHFIDDAAMAELGGAQVFLAQLTGAGANVLAAHGNAEHIRALSRRRRLIDGLQAALAFGHQGDVELEEVIAQAEQALADAADADEGEQDVSAGKAAARVIDGLHEDRHAGVRSGLKALDATLGAIQPKNLVILAARPAMGKSATAISYAIGAARRGHGVLFISHEMSADEIAERALSDLCFDGEDRVPFNTITSGNINQVQGRTLARAQLELDALPFTIIDVGSATVGSLGRRVRRHKRRFAAKGHKLELVIVDYLQLVSPNRSNDNRVNEITQVSQGLKQLAKDQNLAVLALSQLSREVEKLHDKRPQLSHLRDSGSIEQDADTVLFLLRPEYYLRRDEPQADDDKYAAWQESCERSRGIIEFICAKRRRGTEGIGRGMFYGDYQAVR